MLAGGDDYAPCSTAPRRLRGTVKTLAADAGTALTRIGTIEAARGLRLIDNTGAPLALDVHSFDHFTTPAPAP